MDNGWEYEKNVFTRYEQLAKRYEWARRILTFRQFCTVKEIQELKRIFPQLRVRPQ